MQAVPERTSVTAATVAPSFWNRRNAIAAACLLTDRQRWRAFILPVFTIALWSFAQRHTETDLSAPGLAVALIGMGRRAHVAENLKIAEKPVTPSGKWIELFQKA